MAGKTRIPTIKAPSRDKDGADLFLDLVYICGVERIGELTHY